jgi:hypothetical protein
MNKSIIWAGQGIEDICVNIGMVLSRTQRPSISTRASTTGRVSSTSTSSSSSFSSSHHLPAHVTHCNKEQSEYLCMALAEINYLILR